MTDLWLEIKLLSDTSFGRGDGVAGVVDQEVEHDLDTGLPIIKGRTLKGLLVEECANILYSVGLANASALIPLEAAAGRLFGKPGSTMDTQSVLHFGIARLPEALGAEIAAAIAQKQMQPQDVLNALTTIRYQTAVNPETDRPKDNTLRATRAVLRETIFYAPVEANETLTPDDLALFVACVTALRRAGNSRNRGRGRIAVRVLGLKQPSEHYLKRFADRVRGVQ